MKEKKWIWSSENGLTIYDENENNNDFKLGRTIQCKTLKFREKINREKKLLELGFSRKQSLWKIGVKIYFSSS